MGDSESDDEYVSHDEEEREPEELSMEQKIFDMIACDEKEQLVSTIKQQLASENPEVDFERLSSSYLLELVGMLNATECGTALVQGETGLTVDVKVPNECGAFPLHYAAHGWSPALIKLYLEHGAQTDVRCDSHHSTYGGMLPLNAALSPFRDHIYIEDWTPKQSIFKLVIRLCLPKMRSALNVVKFLVWNTEGAEREIYHYAKEGKIIELAVLLIVAREKFNAPFHFPSHDEYQLFEGMSVHQAIAAEIVLSMYEDARAITSSEGNNLAGKEKELMYSALLLLEVFERAGDAIDAYLQLERTNVPIQQVANEVASLLQEAGFILKHQDVDLSDTDQFPSMDTFDKFVWKKPMLSQIEYFKMPLSTQPYRNNENELQNMTTLAHKISNPKAEFMKSLSNEQPRLASLQFPRGSSNLPFNVQSFDTLLSGDNGSSSKLPLTSETHVLNPDEVSLDVEEEIRDLIVADNKYEFASIIKSQLEKQNQYISKSKLFPAELLMWVCCHRAVNCATAIVDGETDLRVDLNSAFKCGSFPLHHAAHSLSSGLIELFLKHGADANIKCDDSGSNFSGSLPLDVALKTLSCHQFFADWTPKKSIAKLLFILCRPEMKEPLDALRVLSLKTKEVEEITFCHAKGGHLIELAALLMVAREKDMAQNNDGSALNGSMRIRQCIIHEIASLVERCRFIDGSQCSELVRVYEDKKALLSSVLLLLEVFERAGLLIEEYLLNHSVHAPPEWVPNQVAWLLYYAGFVLKEEDIVMDDIECFSPKLGPEQSEVLKECRSLVKKFRMPLNSQRGGVSCTKSLIGMPCQQQRSIRFSRGYPVSSPVSRSYHTFQIPKPICGYKFVSTLEAEMKKTNKTSQHCVSNFPSNKQLASVTFAIRRGLRRV